jgi:ureidoglycolate lyase
MELPIVPLTPEAYAPYGEVLCAAPRGEPGKVANYGTARRFDRLVRLENQRPHATPNLSVFRSAARTDFPFRIQMLEKHPASTQVFVPMNASRYLVVVALGDETPELATLRLFLASNQQGISYHPGVWHHPLFNLDKEADFTCLVYEDDTAHDCVECAFQTADEAAAAKPTLAVVTPALFVGAP